MEVVTTNRSSAFGRTRQSRHPKSNGETSTSLKKKTPQRSFLTYNFEDLPIFNQLKYSDYNVSQKVEDGERILYIGNERINFTSNFDNLHNAVNAYCKVHNSLCPLIDEKHPFEMIRSLFSAVKRCCPDNNEIVVDYDTRSKEIVFIEYAKCNYPLYTCGFIPVKYIASMEQPYRQFFIEFISLMRSTMCIEFPEDHYDFAFILGLMGDDYVDAEYEESDDCQPFIDRYLHGDIHGLFNEIRNTPWQQLVLDCKEMTDRIVSLIYNAPSKELKELIQLAIDGIKLMADESINFYRHDLNQCEIDEFDNSDYYDDIFIIDRLFCICYGDEDNDPIVNRALDVMNDIACNYEQEELYDYKVITSDYDTPFLGNDFPNQWFDFLAKYNQARWKYEQTYEINE